jgi:CRP-like cAMP-binding protein
VDFKTRNQYSSKDYPELHYEIDDPEDEDFNNDIVETKLLEIDQLGSGDCFGDDSLLNGENGEGIPMIHSVVTSIPTEIFVLDEHDFHNLGDKI